MPMQFPSFGARTRPDPRQPSTSSNLELDEYEITDSITGRTFSIFRRKGLPPPTEQEIDEEIGTRNKNESTSTFDSVNRFGGGVSDRPTFGGRLRESFTGMFEPMFHASNISSGNPISQQYAADMGMAMLGGIKDIFQDFTGIGEEEIPGVESPTLPERFKKGAINTGAMLLGIDPQAVGEDWQSGNYSALAGDLLLPAGVAGLTMGAARRAPLAPNKRTWLLPEREVTPPVEAAPKTAVVPDVTPQVKFDMGAQPPEAIRNQMATGEVGRITPDVDTSALGKPADYLGLRRSRVDSIPDYTPERMRPKIEERMLSPEEMAWTELVPDRFKRGPNDPIANTSKKASRIEFEDWPKSPAAEAVKPVAAALSESPNPVVREVVTHPAAQAATRTFVEQASGGTVDELGELVKNRTGTVKRGLKHTYQQTMTSGEGILNSLGPAGKKLALLLRDIETEGSARGGAHVAFIREQTKGLSKVEKAQVVDLLDGLVGPNEVSNPRVVSVYRNLRKMTDEIADRAEAAKISIRSSSGKTTEFKRLAGEFFPHRYSPDVLEKLFANSESLTAELIKAGKSPKEAARIVEKMKEFGERITDVQHGREVNLPGYTKDLKVLESYMYDMERRLIEAERLGVKDLGDVKSPVSQLVRETTDPEQAYKVTREALGRSEVHNPDVKKMLEMASKFQVVTKLSQFIINNTADFLNIWRDTSTKNFLTSFTKAITKDPEAISNAIRSGAWELFHRGLLDDVQSGNIIGRAYGITPMEKLIRTVGANAGRAEILDLFTKLKARPTNKYVRKQFGRLIEGGEASIDNVLAQGELNAKQLDFAAGRFVENTSGKPNPLSLPPVFGSSSPFVKAAFLFKRFAFTSTKNMKDSILANPNPDHIAKILALYMIGGEAVGDVKAAFNGIVQGAVDPNKSIAQQVSENIANRGEYFDSSRYIELDPKTNALIDRLAANASQAWLLGMIGSITESASFGSRGLIDFAAGPIYGDAIRAFEVVNSLRSPQEGAFKRKLGDELARRVPYVGQGAAKAFRNKREEKPSKRKKGPFDLDMPSLGLPPIKIQ